MLDCPTNKRRQSAAVFEDCGTCYLGDHSRLPAQRRSWQIWGLSLPTRVAEAKKISPGVASSYFLFFLGRAAHSFLITQRGGPGRHCGANGGKVPPFAKTAALAALATATASQHRVKIPTDFMAIFTDWQFYTRELMQNRIGEASSGKSLL
eukprot:g44357.t1